MNRAGERLINGLAKENPTFVLMLGMCPTLAVTTSAMNGLGMGLTTMVVLALSNLFISLLRKIIPDRVRIPAFIVIIASFVTAVQLLLEGYLPTLNKSLGVYIPLIVVNCIILGRAESYAYSNPPIPSLFDGIGMGLGFTVALTCIGAVREILGAGELFGYGLLPDSFVPIRIFGQAPGAFFVLAALVALQNFVKEKRKTAGKSYEKIGSGCSEDCMNCADTGCSKRFYGESGAKKSNNLKEEKEKGIFGDGNVREKPVKKQNEKEKTVQEASVKEKHTEEKSAKEQTATVKSANEKTPTVKSAKEKSVKEKSPKEKPVKKKVEEKSKVTQNIMEDDLVIVDLEEEDK